jgi:hypothetical protein
MDFNITMTKTTPVNVNALTPEEQRLLFGALFDADPSLPNALNPEQRHRLYAVLVALDPALVIPVSVHGVEDKQVT